MQLPHITEHVSSNVRIWEAKGYWYQQLHAVNVVRNVGIWEAKGVVRVRAPHGEKTGNIGGERRQGILGLYI